MKTAALAAILLLPAAAGAAGELHATLTLEMEATTFGGVTAVDGAVVGVTTAGVVYAFDPVASRGLWSFDVGGTVQARPVTWKGTLVVVARDGTVDLLSGGDRVARHQVVDDVVATPLLDGDALVVAGGSKVALYRLPEMVEEWTFQAGGEVYGTPVKLGGSFLFGAYDGFAYAVRDGALAGKFQVGGKILASPFPTPDSVLVATRNGILVALDHGLAQEKWRRSGLGPFLHAPSQAPACVAIGSLEGRLHCLDATSGKDVWVTAPLDIWALAQPVLDGQVLYAASGTGRLHAFDAASGQKLWNTTLGSGIESLSWVEGRLVAAADDGDVHVLQALDGDATTLQEASFPRKAAVDGPEAAPLPWWVPAAACLALARVRRPR